MCHKPEERRKKMKQITTFTKSYIHALFQGKISKPGLGDCWYCALHTVEDNKPLGEAINSPSHLKEHIRQRYYVPSLLWNAIQAFPVSNVAQWTLGGLWGFCEPFRGFEDIANAQFRASLRRYLRKHLSGR
jgi:hypothetical protein